MPIITVASQNPVKQRASLAAFQRVFPEQAFHARGIDVASGVAEQPMSQHETWQGAVNRAANARAAQPESDYWVGIEGGIEQTALGMSCFAWVQVLGRDARVGCGQTAVFFLPSEVAELVRAGLELGEADDKVFGRINSKQGNGAIGLLTDDAIDRQAYYVQAVIMALVPFKNPQLHWSSPTPAHWVE
ncbi:MAG: inosine/xanthosine triphosphatase [Chloroflexi bacterium]|nr:inosine/xanthosine triphosphatase [Chloroflexota bacterium]MCY3581824.1 inosine/xanthosine triphosphatase [Chloroflexota bacterium]MCY3716111.1 inosine/xanthosine triphosphatase [Chloroflexota bacterium]MDE2650732.1 inosine/xanthosine triphosphatase [Chloroflexota bacterium]MXX52223.1 non-canonical purine NTP phosphatase [Chloroflexota bacterium]